MFLNLTMLAGLGGAAVPLVLHLLSRARYKSIDWGAIMFLEGVDVRQRQSTRLKQLILLIMLMAIVALLAMALARPIVRGARVARAQDGRTTAVIVLDRSASMGFDENGHSRLDLARDAVLQVLSTLRKGDQVSLVLVGDNDHDTSAQPNSDLQAVASRVNSLKVSFGAADIAHGLVKAADIFDRYEKYNRELYLICDRQAASWTGINETFRSAWDQRLKKSPAPLRFYVIPVGGAEADNVAIQSVELINPPAIKDQPSDVEIQIRNFGAIPRASLPLKLAADGREVLNTTVNIAPDATASVRASVKFPAAGSQVLSASVKSAGLTVDDRMDWVIDVVEPTKVLVVSGDERAGLFRSESDFLKLALSPYSTAKKPGPDPAAVTVIPAEKWTDLDLSPYQVVVLANVSRFTAGQVRAMEQFVYGGGGLLIAPGNLARIDNYNALLYHDGSGIMPAMLQNATASDGSQATSLLGIDLTHPIFKFLKGRPDPIPSATIGRYFPSKPRQTDVRVLASYVSGQSFVTEMTLSRGRVLLVTTSMDADWSTLPLSNFFLPFAQSAVRYLASGTLTNRNLTPGQPMTASLPILPDEKTATVTLPDGKQQPVDIMRYAQRAEVRYPNTDQPGQYVLQYKGAGKPQSMDFVVQTPRAESDLTPLSLEKWQQMRDALKFELVDTNKTTISSALSGARAGKELWGTLLAAVLVLSLVELMLAKTWSQEEVST